TLNHSDASCISQELSARNIRNALKCGLMWRKLACCSILMLIMLLGTSSRVSALEKRWTQIVPNIVSPSRLPDKVGARTRITFATAADALYDDIDITDGELTYTTIK